MRQQHAEQQDEQAGVQRVTARPSLQARADGAPSPDLKVDVGDCSETEARCDRDHSRGDERPVSELNPTRMSRGRECRPSGSRGTRHQLLFQLLFQLEFEFQLELLFQPPPQPPPQREKRWCPKR